MNKAKRLLKWTGIALSILVAILLMVNACFVWSTGARLETQLAAIRESGAPLSLAELPREPIPPETNAATYLRRAQADVAAIEREIAKLSEGSAYPVVPLSAEQQRVVETAFQAYPKVIPLLEQAASCTDYDEPADYTLPASEFIAKQLPAVQGFRAVARVLRARALLLASRGDVDGAVRASLAMLRLARLYDRNPTLVSYLVGIAVRGIAIGAANQAVQTGPISPRLRAELEADLAGEERMEGYRWAIQSERAVGRDFFATLPGRNFWLGGRAIWNARESEYLGLMDEFLALTEDRRSYRESQKAIRRIYADIVNTQTGVFAMQVFPAVEAVHEAQVRNRALARSLRVLNAIQAREPWPDGAAPELSELGLPAEATIDPYTGDPLHVKRLPQGWMVYSVGKDFTDDGGKLDDYSDVGLGPLPPPAKPPR